MKIAPIALALALIAGSGGAALAERDRCPGTAGQTWMAIETVIQKAEALGYAVKEAKRSDGCWEIEGYDRNGAEIEIRFHPVSGEVVKPRGWRAPRG